jgi:hypothetical protein
MKFTIPLLLSTAVLLPSISAAAENENLMTFDKGQVISNYSHAFTSGYLPIKAGKLYTIRTSGGDTWTIQVESIDGSWVKSTVGMYVNIDNIFSVEPI